RRVFFRAWRWSAAILLVLVAAAIVPAVFFKHAAPVGPPTAGPPTPIWPIIAAIGGAVSALSALVSTIIALLTFRRATAISGSTSQEPQTQASSEAKPNDRPHSAPPPVT